MNTTQILMEIENLEMQIRCGQYLHLTDCFVLLARLQHLQTTLIEKIAAQSGCYVPVR